MKSLHTGPLEGTGDRTLLDLVLAVDELSESEEETARIVTALLASGRVRLRASLRLDERAERSRRAARAS